MLGVVLVEFAAQLVDVHPYRRVLRDVEVGSAAEDFDGNHRLLGDLTGP